MTPAQRKIYFGLWSTVCRVQGWKSSDEARRHSVTIECMSAIRGPQVDSTSGLGEDEITALLCYLQFLAKPDGLDESARWLDCQQDYRMFNRARQADWHEGKTYGRGKNKLDRDRFAGATSAKGEPLESFDPEAIRKRHLTMASRHQKKQRKEGTASRKGHQMVLPSSASIPPGRAVNCSMPEPVYVPPPPGSDEPF